MSNDVRADARLVPLSNEPVLTESDRAVLGELNRMYVDLMRQCIAKVESTAVKEAYEAAHQTHLKKMKGWCGYVEGLRVVT